jgi:hypothetical protein
MPTSNPPRHGWLAAGAFASILAVVSCASVSQGANSSAAAPVAPAAAAPAQPVQTGASQPTFMNASIVNPLSGSLQAEDDWADSESADESDAQPAVQDQAPVADVTPAPSTAALQPVDPATLNQVLDMSSIQNAMNQLSQMSQSMSTFPTPDPSAPAPSGTMIPFSIVLTPGASPVEAVPLPTYTPAGQPR